MAQYHHFLRIKLEAENCVLILWHPRIIAIKVLQPMKLLSRLYSLYWAFSFCRPVVLMEKKRRKKKNPSLHKTTVPIYWPINRLLMHVEIIIKSQMLNWEADFKHWSAWACCEVWTVRALDSDKWTVAYIPYTLQLMRHSITGCDFFFNF